MRIATCIEHSDVSAMRKLCRDKDKVVVNYAELKHSADLAECFSGQQSPNLILISEYGLYRIFAKCNLPKCEPISNPLIPVLLWNLLRIVTDPFLFTIITNGYY